MNNTSIPGDTAFTASALCQYCGLCCTGVLHSYIRVEPEEIEHISKAGIPLRKAKNDKVYFVPPCVCLVDNTCSIHETKPKVCRDDHCTLQKNVMNGSETDDDARRVIKRFKQAAEKLREQVTPPKNRDVSELNLHSFLLSFFDTMVKARKTRDYTPEETTFIYDSFEYAKLVDRYFLKTPLLVKFSDLILSIEDRG